MTMDSITAGAAAQRNPEPLGPAPFVRVMIRPMTKKLNRVMLRFAGREHFLGAAQIKHIGRRSGKAYGTPVSARLVGDLAVVPLTFGNQSDWAQNVQAARGGALRFGGVDYVVTEPEYLSRPAAKPLTSVAFSPVQRAMFRALGIRQFMILHASPVGD